jgi:hypothetical protein
MPQKRPETHAPEETCSPMPQKNPAAPCPRSNLQPHAPTHAQICMDSLHVSCTRSEAFSPYRGGLRP